MADLLPRLVAVFNRGSNRSPSPNPSQTYPPPSSTHPDLYDLVMTGAPPPIFTPSLPVLDEATRKKLGHRLLLGQLYRIETLQHSYFLNLRWANENGIPAPIVVAKCSQSFSETQCGPMRAMQGSSAPTECYLVWYPEHASRQGSVVRAEKLEAPAFERVVEQLKGILEKFHDREDKRREGVKGLIGTEGGENIMRLGPRECRGEIEALKTPTTQEGYWAHWQCIEREKDELDPTGTRMVLTTPSNNSVPEETEEHLKRICRKDWKIRFTHGCLVASSIWCKKDGTIVSIEEWANAGWWPEWFEAARAMKSMRFDRIGKPWVATLKQSGIFADTEEFWEATIHIEIFLDNGGDSNAKCIEGMKRGPRTQAARLVKHL